MHVTNQWEKVEYELFVSSETEKRSAAQVLVSGKRIAILSAHV